MSDDEIEDTTIYKVVVNHEEQYSIWPSEQNNPLGWLDAGKSGTKAECLAFIAVTWTDMTPLSLREKPEEAASTGGPNEFASPNTWPQGSIARELIPQRL